MGAKIMEAEIITTDCAIQISAGILPHTFYNVVIYTNGVFLCEVFARAAPSLNGIYLYLHEP